VDSGRVSYSNPPRQWLFDLEDAKNSAPKATTAASKLLKILPNANIAGVDMSIPLPGHPADLEKIDETHRKLVDLIDSHDVIFMLTDSRESRWLPSLIVAAKQSTRGKDELAQKSPPLGISVALGFDSYLIKLQSYGDCATAACYFCNDVNAPSDSTAFRTLDQQCTVTRPGIAAIASCMAVELVATLAQSRHGLATARTVADDPSTSPLGAVPDQIRGFLGSFQSFPAVTEKFDFCVCCSHKVVCDYQQRGIEMVNQVVRDGSQLMEISGLGEYTIKLGDGVSELEFSDIDWDEEVGG
jgi:ubiquitin-like modifier-activating enzyme ATG7